MPHARVIPTIHCAVDPEIVMDGRALAPKLANHADLQRYQDNHEARHNSLDTISFTFQTGDAIDEACFRKFTEKPAAGSFPNERTGAIPGSHPFWSIMLEEKRK